MVNGETGAELLVTAHNESQGQPEVDNLPVIDSGTCQTPSHAIHSIFEMLQDVSSSSIEQLKSVALLAFHDMFAAKSRIWHSTLYRPYRPTWGKLR